jgi:hypothetical protein
MLKTQGLSPHLHTRIFFVNSLFFDFLPTMSSSVLSSLYNQILVPVRLSAILGTNLMEEGHVSILAAVHGVEHVAPFHWSMISPDPPVVALGIKIHRKVSYAAILAISTIL